MIDFELLEKLIGSARNRFSGKPLAGVGTLLTSPYRYSRGGMHNCRLFQLNDTNWRVDLHNNPIAYITKQDDGSALVRVESVEDYPTVTTAARLSSILGPVVFKHKNKLRVRAHNFRGEFRWSSAPPIMNGQLFHLDRNKVRVMNPEIMKERAHRVNREQAKKYAPMLRRIQKVGVVTAKVATTAYAELAGDNRWFDANHLARDADSIDTDVLVGRLMAAGARLQVRVYYLVNRAKVGQMVSSEDALRFFNAGFRKFKEALYRCEGVYEGYDKTFTEQFDVART